MALGVNRSAAEVERHSNVNAGDTSVRSASSRSSRRTEAVGTRSIALLSQRIPDFSVVEFTDRWKRYEVFEELGRGAMGKVYRALDRQLRREVALKCVIEDEESNQHVVERFVDEIVLHARLTHPAIAPIYDFGLTPQGHLFMAMEVVYGESLEAIIHRYHTEEDADTSLHLNDLLVRFMKVCEAISFSHGQGIIHRDLKPENIMCGEFGEVFVMDWGLATTVDAVPQNVAMFNEAFSVSDAERAHAMEEVRRMVEERMEKARRKKHSAIDLDLAHKSMMGSVVGTVGYLSPEQALGRDVGHATDIYSLSCILYHILCGKPPVSSAGQEGSGVWGVLDAVIDGRILPPTQRGSARPISESLSAIAMRGLHRDPRQRYATVDELRGDLLGWIRQQSRARQLTVDIEDNLVKAERKVASGRAEEARLLLHGAMDSLEGLEGVEHLRRNVQLVLDDAARLVAERQERLAAGKAFRDLQNAVMESQFGLILGHLRLPAPTIRRAHDHLLQGLQSSGCWNDPVYTLERFRKLEIEQRSGGGETELRDQMVAALFLFGWVSVRMAMVTSTAHGKEMFERHAEQAMRQLSKLSTSYRAPLLLKARLARMREDQDEEARLLNQAANMPVRGADDHTFLATIRFVDYQIREAFDHLEQALALDPSAFWAHALLIFVNYGMGNREAAFAALRSCQALQPRQSILWTIRGFLLREYGEFDAAHDALGRGLRYGPNDPLARLIRADVRLRLGRIDWERDLDTAGDLVTPPRSTWDYFVLALIALYKKDTEYAREFVVAAMMRSPGMPQLYGLEASILMRIGDYDLAEQSLRKALDLAPHDPRLTESLLGLLVHQKRYGEARSKFPVAEQSRPGAASPHVLLLAARAFAGYVGEDNDDDNSNLAQALLLLQRAARAQVISRREVEHVPEFASVRDRPEFRRLLLTLRDGPPVPRLFQPSMDDLQDS